MKEIKRGVREVCYEALDLLKEEYDPNKLIRAGSIVGYFDEILSILNETEDDIK